MIDRILAAWRALVRAELGRSLFFGVYEYVVQRVDPGTVDVAPASSLALPALSGVPLVSSLLGQDVSPVGLGQPCRIRFVNGDPARPVCVGLALRPADAIVDATTELALAPGAQGVALAGGSAEIAREGDAVTIFLPPGVLVGVVTPPGGAPVTVGSLTVLSALSGIISGGAARSSA